MKSEQLERMKHGAGFIAALDQSGGSTPKALSDYGIDTSEYHTEDEMYDLIQQMRSRIIASKAFSSNHILGAILFEKTMERKIDNLYTADYLWEKKGIVPFLKIDNGLDELKDGVQLMKPIPKLDELLNRAAARNIFGTKMRSVIHEANRVGIHAIVEQQFDLGQKIYDAGFIPIVEPEVDIHSSSKQEAEEILIEEIISHLKKRDDSMNIMLKVSIPSVAGAYNDLMNDPRIVRIVALSGGYSRKEADELLKQNPKLIASFSRALLSDLSVKQTQQEFDAVLLKAIIEIYEASL
ncbi:fructose bisphosphate aldolase [Lacrimispora defluvii]|uniref:fructose-bisphosphate aldolase n=1 Tax=Lacrimispora defluvii TaxID=2719233 RepID=A0ABX1VXC7_9FIRM|nr:fructose bisphosphate aldolase [Lacrimispora defluvii]NNJ30848.1 fructose bisphosphate aldolase [Lacrimispora defluvii]